MQIGVNIFSRMLLSINKSAALESATNAVVVLHSTDVCTNFVDVTLLSQQKQRIAVYS